ncbi:MAG TPA: hypothetical protein VMU62_08185 [Acidobacteriaceae bacterium]|nr:hypothetical protein [Acidobacteriaceae bacterium]
MPKDMCVDPTVGDILSGWRYDISGLHFEMRKDYEEHLRTCSHCHARQRLHRTIDMLLIGVTTVSILGFVVALAVLHKIEPLGSWVLLHLQLHQISLGVSVQLIAVLGLLLSLAAWIIVAITTPAPSFISEQAKALQERIPVEVRDRLPKHSV